MGRRSRWPSCTGADRPAMRYRVTSNGQSKPRPLYVTSQASGGIRPASSSSRARSSAWSGSTSWTWWNRSPCHQPRPMRKASVPVAVARPVVSVSRQTSGRPGGGCPGRVASRSRSMGRSMLRPSTRTYRPSPVRTTSPSSVSASRSASASPPSGAWGRGSVGAPVSGARTAARNRSRRRARSVGGRATGAVTRPGPARRRSASGAPQARPAAGGRGPGHRRSVRGADPCTTGSRRRSCSPR